MDFEDWVLELAEDMSLTDAQVGRQVRDFLRIPAENVGSARYGEPVTEHSTPREPAWMTDPDRDDGEIQWAGDDGEEP